MSQWGSSDSGILRKNRADENLDQLLVFGYSCKIFRDDEKAQYIDQGKHLIPWMGDETLKIDRYDGRGVLQDIKKFEASREGYDALRWLGLSESEKKLEELCDSERYYSLEINEEEEEMYKEEAAKRQKTNAFAFDYNPQPVEPEKSDGIPTVPEKEEEDLPYKPSPVLDVPIDINIPNTVKEYARIEKTALFVCRQGPQMEILIKAKQADNPQFSFLTVQDPLYKFYRHVLAAFKNGRYQPQCEKKTDEPKPKAVAPEADQDTHYLHPSLVSAGGKPATPPPVQNPPIPTVPYRPSADCAYSQLVNRIQGAGLGSNGQPDAQGAAVGQQQGVTTVDPKQMQIISQMNLEQQYHQYYYVQQFYEYWRHTVVNSEQGAVYGGLPLEFSQLDPNMQSYIHQLAWAQFVQHHQKQIQEAQQAQAQAQASATSNSYAQIVSNLNKDGVNPYTANVPQLPPREEVIEEPKVVTSEETNKEERTVTLVKSEDKEVGKPLLSLAVAYGSESESESESTDSESDSEASVKQEPQEKREVYRVPSGEIQTVIDKMAEYVSKNGEQFEEIIKQKGDPRFDFLREGHEFNKYYRTKLRELKGEPEEKVVKKVDQPKPKVKPKKVIAPVSFSIKKPKEEPSKEIKSALPMEDSSEEESYLDNLPKSPPVAKTATNNNNSTSHKMPPNPKVIYKIGQLVMANLLQPKFPQVIETHMAESGVGRPPPSKEGGVALVQHSSPSNGTRSTTPLRAKSPRRHSKSSSSSPVRHSRRSRTPKKRSRTPTRSPIPSKRPKSRSKTPSKKSPTRRKESPPKSMKLTPIEEHKVRTKKKKSPVIDIFDVGDDDDSKEEKLENGVLIKDDPILEMMELEKEQKTDAYPARQPAIIRTDKGEQNRQRVNNTDSPDKTEERAAADLKEKARQLERKRKAAMFLKLKSVETKVVASSTVTEKTEKYSPAKSQKSSVKSERNSRRSPSTQSSRRNSEDSVLSVRSKSITREKSKLKEKPVSRDKSRSRSMEGNFLSRRSRSRERRKDSKKHKKNKDRDRSRSKDREDEDRKRRKEKKKKSHKRKHSKSKKKTKKHKRSRSRSRSKTRSSRSRSKSRSSSVKSHISIDST